MNTTNTLRECITLLQQHQPVKALEIIRPMMETNPNDATAWTVYGEVLVQNDLYLAGLDAWIEADSRTPQPIDIVRKMAQIARKFGRTKDALQYFGRCIELQPTADNMETCGNFLLEIGQLNEAEQLLTIASSTGNLRAIAGLIDLRVRQNRRPEAADLVTQHLQRITEEPALIQACARLMLAEKEYHSALEVLCMIDVNRLPPETTSVHFRLLGETLDKLGRHAEAFKAYQQFNNLRGCTYDSEQHHIHLTSIKETHHSKSSVQSTCESNRPVFIVGMPRSGTSLLEQILSMHTDIYGAGELDHIPSLIKEYGVDSTESLNQIATEYLKRLNTLNTSATFVTDKLPHNYEQLGNISRIFPNAKIIYCTRDAMDIGWSCYRQNFHQNLNFATDLWSIGDYHRQLIDLMTHWRKTLRIPIHEISYEDLVQTPEVILRRIFEFLKIEWNPNVLNFHTSDRIVHTASSIQVQEPLYTKSIGGSSPYSKWLSPLQHGFVGKPKND